MFIIKEKNSVKVVLKINSKENENLETVKNRINNITSEFNIFLDLDIKIDDTVPNNEIRIEYYSKANGDEIIGKNYLKFLDKFLDLGYENGVNTVPME
jgi:flagellar hook assembly protein FlgD